jgi:GH18 family chitinase
LIAWLPSNLPAQGEIIAYLPDYRIDQLETGSVNRLKGITTLVYFSATPLVTGDIEIDSLRGQRIAKLQHVKQATGCQLVLGVGGWQRSDHFQTIAANPEIRSSFADRLTEFLGLNNFIGVDIDWEHPRSKQELADLGHLIRALRLASETKPLWISVAQAGWQDLGKEIYEEVDRVHLMAYDHDFPQATMEKTVADLDRLIGWGCPPGKIALGVPFYGRNQQGNARTYRELVDLDANSTTDQIDGYAFNSRDTVARKTELSLQRGLAGMMIWEIGQDTSSLNTSLLSTIVSRVPTTANRNTK